MSAKCMIEAKILAIATSVNLLVYKCMLHYNATHVQGKIGCKVLSHYIMHCLNLKNIMLHCNKCLFSDKAVFSSLW